MRKFRRASFIVFLTFAFIVGMSACGGEKKTVKKELQETIEVIRIDTVSNERFLTAEGLIDYLEKPYPIVFHIAGTLEKGQLKLKPGTEFRRGQLLYQVDNRRAYSELRAYLRELHAALEGFMSELDKSLPQHSNKWQIFSASVNPAQLLPDFPFITPAEKTILKNYPVEAAYQRASSAEKSMADYFYIAQRDGMVLESFVRPGKMLSGGEIVATLAGSRNYFVRIRVQPGETAAAFQSAGNRVTLFDQQGNQLGTGKLSKVQTYDGKIILGYVVTPGKNTVLKKDQLVSVRSEIKSREEGIKLPLTAVHGDSVCIIRADGMIAKAFIKTGQPEKDSVRVYGLKQDDRVLVNFRDSHSAPKKFRVKLVN